MSYLPTTSIPKTNPPPINTSFKTLDSLIHQTHEWNSLPPIIFQSIKTLSSIITSQSTQIANFEKSLNNTMKISDFQSAISSKLEYADFAQAVSDINNSISTRPCIEEIQALTEEKISKKEFQNAVKNWVSMDDFSNIISTKPDITEINRTWNGFQNQIDNVSNNINKKISQYPTWKDMNKLSQQLTNKVNSTDIIEILSNKIDKDEVYSLLKPKANKTEVEMQLNNKININEYNEWISILNNKVSIDDYDSCVSQINTKLDKATFTSTVNDLCATKLDIKQFEWYLNETALFKENTNRKINDIDTDLDRWIENIKIQFQNVNSVISQLDMNKMNTSQIDELTTAIARKLDSSKFLEDVNIWKFDFDEHLNTLKAEIEKTRQHYVDVMNSKYETVVTEFNKNFEMIKSDVWEQCARSKAMKNDWEILNKSVNESATQRRFDDTEWSAKFAHIYDTLKQKTESKELIRNFNIYEARMTQKYEQEITTKCTYSDLDVMYSNILKEMTKRYSELHANVNNSWDKLVNEISNINKDKLGKEGVDKLWNTKLESVNSIWNSKISGWEFLQLKQCVESNKEIANERVTLKLFEDTIFKINKHMDDIEAALKQKCNTNNLQALLVNKPDCQEVHSLSWKLSEMHVEKVSVEQFNKFIANQNIINNMILINNAVGRWCWKSGNLKNGNAIPWEIESINTTPDNFYWEKDKSTIWIAKDGCYLVQFGLISEDENAVIKILRNGECLICVDVKGKNKVVNEIVNVENKARLTVVVENGEGKNEGFLCVTRV